VPALEPGFH